MAHAIPRDARRGSGPAADPDPRRLVLWTIGVLVLVALIVWVSVQVASVLLLVYVSLLLATGADPLVGWLERRRLPWRRRRGQPRWLATLELFGATLLVLAGIAVALVTPLAMQVDQLVEQAPALAERTRATLVERGVPPSVLRGMAAELPSRSEMLNRALLTTWNASGGLLGVFTVLVLTFYFLLEANGLRRAALGRVAAERRPEARRIAREVRRKVTAWLGAQLTLAALIGVLTTIVLGALGVPYFYVIGLLAAAGEFVPYLGPLVAGAVGTLVALASSWQLAAWVAGYFLLQQVLENNVLVPRLMSEGVGMRASAVLVAILIGGALLGIPGAVLAVPTASILGVVLGGLTARR